MPHILLSSHGSEVLLSRRKIMISTRRYYNTLVIIVAVAVSFCSGASRSINESNGQPDRVGVPKNVKGKAQIMEERRIASSYSDFGIDLLKRIAKEEKENILVSPASIAFALSMTINGAKGGTYKAIANTLKLDDIYLDTLNSTNRSMIEDLVAMQDGIELLVANSLWCRRELNFKKDFIDANTLYYGAKVEAIDFSSSDAKDIINNWVKEKTKGKIPTIIDRIKPYDILFLINAIYFKGKWAREFNKNLTKEEIFHAADGSEKKVPMMRRSARFPYIETKDFQGVMLPYKGKRTAMFIILPAKSITINEFVENLEWENLSEWFKNFLPREGEVIIPKFSFDYAASLKDFLSELGMNIAFAPTKADLSGMIEVRGENAFISDVIHKTFIDVTEEGTEAAAATGVEVGLTAVQIKEEPFVFRADRPFLFLIRDNGTGLILFAGIVADPAE